MMLTTSQKPAWNANVMCRKLNEENQEPTLLVTAMQRMKCNPRKLNYAPYNISYSSVPNITLFTCIILLLEDRLLQSGGKHPIYC